MPIIKKRDWKSVELTEADLADFSSMGGVEIDVMSIDSDFGITSASKKSVVKAESQPAKKKPKKKVKKVAVDAGVEVAVTESVEPIEEELDMSAWETLNCTLHPLLMEGLKNLKFTTPSPIQSAVIGKGLEGFDVLAAAETGSGKTLAFGLPILHSILSAPAGETKRTCALCVLPTRELALQVKSHLEAVVGPKSGVTVGAALGGMSIDKQLRILKQNPDIVVGTPGRIASLLGLMKESDPLQTSAQFKENVGEHLKFLVLDEADRLLEDAHFRDLTSILRFVYQSVNSTPESLQSLVFSATLPVEGSQLGKLLRRLRLKPESKRVLVDLVKSAIGTTPSSAPSPVVPKGLTFKTVTATNEDDREPLLIYYLLRQLVSRESGSVTIKNAKVIVFVNAISYVYRLASLLPLCLPEGIRVVGIHSNLRQKDRLKKMDQFKASSSAVMVATDLAARGLDMPAVSAVVHLQPPRSSESLIHRSGRTARAGNTGECMLLVTPKMHLQWNKCTRNGLSKDVEDVGTPMDIVSGDLRQVKEIHRVAAEIEGKGHKHRRETKEKAWTEKTCQEADLWDSDCENSDQESDADVFIDGVVEGPRPTGQTKSSASSEAEHLKELLRNPLPSLANK